MYSPYGDDDGGDEATAAAVASLQQSLQGFTSPRASKTSSRKNDYGMNAMEWMKNELASTEEEELSHLPNDAVTPKRTPLMERAGTPIMSNSSKTNLSSLAGSSSKKNQTPGQSKYSLEYSDDDSENNMDDKEFATPLPVQTPAPLQRNFRTASPVPPMTGISPRNFGGNTNMRSPGSNLALHPTTSSSAMALKQTVFRRHHDALLDYWRARRSLDRRMELERQEKALDKEAGAIMNVDDDDDSSNGISQHLAQQECQAEVEYCQSLCRIGHGLTAMMVDSSSSHSEAPMEEGHFWELLSTLRRVGQSALIWDDDPTSLTQNNSSQSFFLQQLTSNPNSTPKELLEALSGENSASQQRQSPSIPLVLQRKQKLLKWIQSCLELESKDLKAKLIKGSKINSPSHPDDSSIPLLVSEMESQTLKQMAQVCLALFLEGKNDEARDIARSHGQAWRAAAWVGGEPSGYIQKLHDSTQTVEKIPVGNPNRFLWKRQVWKAGRKLLVKHSPSQFQPNPRQQTADQTIGLEEAAIYSLLSNDVQSALDNACIRSSWTRSLGVLLMGVQGRTQDEVLHRFNRQMRRNGSCFPGYQYEEQENEQLMNTNHLATMTEGQMARVLANSHFLKQVDEQKEQQQQVPKLSYKSAILAFVVGKSAILEFCDQETDRVVSDLQKFSNGSDDDYLAQDWEGVRFLTHVLIFLESLQFSSTPIVCDGITEQKNKVLFHYVKYLESRPDLWHMIALYVSLLPPTTILDYYPTVLSRVLDDTERQTMIGQIQELMPEQELPLLRRVVREVLAAPTGGESSSVDSMDAIKCNAIQWLLQKEDHMEDALVCANILLREFFNDTSDDKTAVAMRFVHDYLPEDFENSIREFARERQARQIEEGTSNAKLNSDEMDQIARVNNAIGEYRAYTEYLEAFGTFEKWKETLKATPTSLEDSNILQLPNYKNLNETEQSIAKASFRRDYTKAKKKHLEITLSAAEDARLAWHTVLTHEGGWLDLEADDQLLSVDAEEQKRRLDIQTIRSRHLVLATNLYHQVCEETATWLTMSLREAEDFPFSKKEVLQWLRFQDAGSSGTRFSKVFPANTAQADSHTPDYWYRHALDLATLVASDQHGIHKAFPPGELQDLIAKLGETAVSKLMNV